MVTLAPVANDPNAGSVLFANRVVIVRAPDHFILRFGLQLKENDKTLGRELVQIALPFTAISDLMISLFTGMFKSAMDLQKFFVEMGGKMSNLNHLKAEIEAAQAEGAAPDLTKKQK